MKIWLIYDYDKKTIYHSNKEAINTNFSPKNIYEILGAIKTLGYDCDYFGGIPELIQAVHSHKKFDDAVFLIFTDGVDQKYSRIQAPALLDILQVPYSGSEVFPSVMMNNKFFCKKTLSKLGINMPNSCIVNNNLPFNFLKLQKMKFPLFVKPNCEEGALGISPDCICHTINDTINKGNELLCKFDEIMIEEYIKGIDLANYLIGNENFYSINSIITTELYNKSSFTIYSPNEKRTNLRTLFLDEEYLSLDLVKKIKEQSVLIAQTLDVHDICRIDYRINLSNYEVNFIEINSAPHFSNSSEIGFIAQKKNISFLQMMQYYLETVLKRLIY